MGLKAPSQLYMEGHAGNLLICKLKADETVQLAIESQLARETNWTRKSSTIVQCQEIIDIVSDNSFFPTPTNCHNYQSSVASETPKLKKAVKNTILDQVKEKWNKKAQDLEIQGDFLKLLIEDDSDVTWKSYIYGEPNRVNVLCNAVNHKHTCNSRQPQKMERSDICTMCQEPNKVPAKCTLPHIGPSEVRATSGAT